MLKVTLSGSIYAQKVAGLQGESNGKTLRSQRKGQNSSCGQCNPQRNTY
jgi:hypothetical protein